MQALDRVDVDVWAGEILALAGENGAGKSTLVRSLVGDIRLDRGEVTFGGERVEANAPRARQLGVEVVWQDLALCDNLDIAANLLLGRERRRSMLSGSRFYADAARIVASLGLSLPPLSTAVGHLSGGQRQLVAIARAMRDRPALLVLDEPTASLGVAESALVEQFIADVARCGTTVLVVTHDLDQMFRLADRILILRAGRTVASVTPAASHPDDVAALISGQEPEGSARSQLSRLNHLADQLAAAQPSSSISLICSALGAALGGATVCIYERCGLQLRLVGSSVPGPGRISLGPQAAGRSEAWSVPFSGSGIDGVVSVEAGTGLVADRDRAGIVNVYSGYIAAALARDRLLCELEERNRSLETVTAVLEYLAGPGPLDSALAAALGHLRRGTGAEAVALADTVGGELSVRAASPASGSAAARLEEAIRDPKLRTRSGIETRAFEAAGRRGALLAVWNGDVPATAGPVLDDGANALRLAIEREASEIAQTEALALRRSQGQQRKFLSWLSHELRTPLTAIRGYASSLMQPDVDWDGPSTQRFLTCIAGESARLGRLVDDLLDFSAIDAGILRLDPDWCDLGLVVEAALSCLPEESTSRVEVTVADGMPAVWADHDRIEQVLVNLLGNAVRHNPPDTRITAEARPHGDGGAVVVVEDDGTGVPPAVAGSGGVFGRPGERRSRSGGAGLGLSIAHGIVTAHGGTLTVERCEPGTRCTVVLPPGPGATDG